MSYVEGLLIAVPTEKKDAFRQFAEEVNAAMIENGATEVVDCWGVDVPEGELTSMPKAVNLKDGEVVVFSWIRWPSKLARDSAVQRVFADTAKARNPPFDGKRMILGAFEPIVEMRA